MEIVILLSLLIAWRISKRHARPQKRRQEPRKASQPARPAPPGKAATTERKAAYIKARSYHDAKAAEREINRLCVLLDIAKADYYNGPISQQEKALKKINSLDKQLSAAENRLEKAKYTFQTTED